MKQNSVEIRCSECGEDAILKREPIYEGFKKTGESLSCSSCGHKFASEDAVPFQTKRKPAIFSEADKPKIIDVFKDDAKGQTCLHCANYTINPFTQRCSLTNRIIQATDSCNRFAQKQEKKEEQTPDTGNPQNSSHAKAGV